MRLIRQCTVSVALVNRAVKVELKIATLRYVRPMSMWIVEISTAQCYGHELLYDVLCNPIFMMMMYNDLMCT